MSEKIAIFPGSFDPVTIGHHSIVMNSLDLFDKVYVALGSNSQKKYLFSESQRLKMIKEAFNHPKIECLSYEGLTIDLCKKLNAHFILRGLRNFHDFKYEQDIAHMNSAMNNSVQTIFMLCEPKYIAINSSIVREIIKNNGDVKQFLPPNTILPKF